MTPEKGLVLNSAGQGKGLDVKKTKIQRKMQISGCQVMCRSSLMVL